MSLFLGRTVNAWSHNTRRIVSRKAFFGSGFNGTHSTFPLSMSEPFAPFRLLDPESHPYTDVIGAGLMWDTCYDPGNMKRYGFESLEKECSGILRKIDTLRSAMEPRISTVAKSLVLEYAHQSARLESNSLGLDDALVINDHLEGGFFRNIDIATMSARELNSITLPSTDKLLPRRERSEVADMRNLIIILRWVAERPTDEPWSTGLSKEEIQTLSAIMIKDTRSEALYSLSWAGGGGQPGDYRNTSIRAKSNHLRVFPYHHEIEYLMKEFFSWRTNARNDRLLHPLLLACHSLVYFLSIHPFLESTGRMGHVLMYDWMVRQGYFPVMLQHLSQTEYLKLVSDCQDENPKAFVMHMLGIQLDMMRTVIWR